MTLLILALIALLIGGFAVAAFVGKVLPFLIVLACVLAAAVALLVVGMLCSVIRWLIEKKDEL